MNLLEPTAVADESNYTSDEISDLFLRRFKKDISHEIGLEKTPASKAEDRVFEILDTIEFKTIARERNNKGVLFRTLLLKAFLSSPAACSSTVGKRLEHKALQEDDPEAPHDRAVLSELKSAVDDVQPKHFSKLQQLIDLLRELGLDKPICTERVVIFSERIDTLDFLETGLKKTLGLVADQIEVFHGALDYQKQKELVKSFGTYEYPPEAFKPGSALMLKVWKQGDPKPIVRAVSSAQAARLWNDFKPYFEGLEEAVTK